MQIAKWTQLLGMDPAKRRWERPLLFFSALCVGELVWLTLAPSYSGDPASAETSLSLFYTPGPGVWFEVILGNLVFAAVATLAFGLVRNFLAIPIAALGYSIVSTGISYLITKLTLPEGISDEFPYWDLYRILNLTSNFLWALILFGLLELAMRVFKDVALALLLGAVCTSLLTFPVQLLIQRLFLDEATPVRLRLMFLPFNILGQTLFMLALWGGLRVSSGPDPLAHPPFEPRISRGYYVGTMVATQGLSILVSVLVLVMLLFTPLWKMRQFSDLTPLLLLLGLILLLAIYGAVVFCHLIYKSWQSIQDGFVRTTPGFAVGGLFIPFYNLYWAFQVFPGFVSDFHAFAWRHGLRVPRLKEGVFTAYVVLCIVSLVPYANLLLLPASFVVMVLMVTEMCKAVNAIPILPPAYGAPRQPQWGPPPPWPPNAPPGGYYRPA